MNVLYYYVRVCVHVTMRVGFPIVKLCACAFMFSSTLGVRAGLCGAVRDEGGRGVRSRRAGGLEARGLHGTHNQHATHHIQFMLCQLFHIFSIVLYKKYSLIFVIFCC